MTITTTMANRGARMRRATRLDLTVDIIVLAVALALGALLFFKGGLEALLGAGVGALVGARAKRAIVSGALAGLFAGALCAGFFHGALAALIAPLIR